MQREMFSRNENLNEPKETHTTTIPNPHLKNM